MISDENEAGGHDDDVRDICVVTKTTGAPPVSHRDEDPCQRGELAKLDAHVEGQQVRDESVRRQLVLEEFRGQTEPVKEAEDERRDLRVRLAPEPPLKGAEIVEGLVRFPLDSRSVVVERSSSRARLQVLSSGRKCRANAAGSDR